MSYVPYQIDYSVTNKAKTFGFSKKKVIFKFGFANSKALSEGLVGAHCRGSEHEITFIWSLNTGKRQIIADSKEVHYSESGQNGWTADRTFQHAFNVYSPEHGSIRCHLITLPVDNNTPGGTRPFDVRINGISYFNFSRIFQLGTPSMVVRPAPARRGGGGGEYGASHEERAAIARAKLESLRDIRQERSRDSQDQQQQHPIPTQDQRMSGMPERTPSGIVREEASLLRFDDDPPPVQGSQGHATGGGPDGGGRQTQHFMSSVSMDPYLLGRASSGGSRGGPYSPSGGGLGGIGIGGAPAPSQAPAPGYGVPAPAPYTNYALPPASAPAPAPYTNYALPPAPGAYGQPQPGFAQPPPAAASAAAAQPPAPYGGMASPGAHSTNGYPPQQSFYGGQPSITDPSAFGGQASFAQPQQSQYSVATSTPSYAQTAPPAFASPQSNVTYGSAPSFAQPPQQQQDPLPPQQQQNSSQSYGHQAYGGYNY